MYRVLVLVADSPFPTAPLQESEQGRFEIEDNFFLLFASGDSTDHFKFVFLFVCKFLGLLFVSACEPLGESLEVFFYLLLPAKVSLLASLSVSG